MVTMAEEYNKYYLIPSWGIWSNTKGKEGKEPPDFLKKVIEIREKHLWEPSQEKRITMALEALKIL